MDVHIRKGEHPGPTVGIFGGLHGDEITGVVAARKLMSVRPIAGELCIVPVLNPEGYTKKERFYRGEDLNHIMPGDTSDACHRHAQQIFRMASKCDYVVDLHAARVGQVNYPHVRADLSLSKNRKLKCGLATINSAATPTTLRGSLNAKGIGCVVVEAGEGLQETYAEEVVAAVRQMLVSLQVLSGETMQGPVYEESDWVYSEGADSVTVSEGDMVNKGEIISKQGVVAPHAGVVVGVYKKPAKKGDRLIHLAYNL